MTGGGTSASILGQFPCFCLQISDFGLSKWMEQSSRMQYIESSALRGTLSYIPPEMFLQNSKPPGIKYDVYR